MEYETEEQQIQALKDWWKENGTSIIVGVVLGVAGFASFNWWQAEKIAKQEAASDAFNAVLKVDAKANQQEFLDAANQVKTDYADSGYALLASLHIAKQYAESDQLGKAEQELRSAIELSIDSSLTPLLQVRLARVLAEQKKHQAAVDLLLTIKDESFAGLQQKTLGTIYLAMGEQDKARAAFVAAKDSVESFAAKNEIEMQINDLVVADAATNEPVASDDSVTEQNTDFAEQGE
ncbi:MAG: tetratricopeptide repeat protein [Kangiellaceae bacterium]|nr:tetratricopeptide repeat protein [Kangiellaceae bacterium]